MPPFASLKSEHGTRLETALQYHGGGEGMSTTTQRRSQPYFLSRRGCCAWMSLSLTSSKPLLSSFSLVRGQVRVNSISKVGNEESKLYAP